MRGLITTPTASCPTRRSSTACAQSPGLEGRDLVREVTAAGDATRGTRAAGTTRRIASRAAHARQARRRLRLRHEAQHPAHARRRRLPRDRGAGDDAGAPRCWRCAPTASSCRTAPAIRRRSPTPPRPAAPSSTRRCRCSASASATRSSALALGGTHLQAQVRPPRRQLPGHGSGDAQGRDHLAEPRLRRRRRLACAARPS